MSGFGGFVMSATLLTLVAVLVLVSAWEHWAGKKRTEMRMVMLVHLILLSVVVLGAGAQSPAPVGPSPSPTPSAVSVEKTPVASSALAVWLSPEHSGSQECKPPKESTVEGPDGKPFTGKVSQCLGGRKAADWKPGRDVPCLITSKHGVTRSVVVIHQDN